MNRVRGRDQQRWRSGETRAVSPTIGVLALVALTVCLAAVIAVGSGAWSIEPGPPTAVFELSADGDRSTIGIENRSGESIDVGRLTVVISVNGTNLSKQPPVPFVGAKGFDGAPDGPFNAKGDRKWTTGERAVLSIAETNSPALGVGDSVTVTLVVDGQLIEKLEGVAT
ncbi:type IV pilin [Natrinema gelatinilyticum]|uniref:type IV pilin n=1 Tax=Natrinema gelatinilyticum TaxID=2961571 RepID=UPI0020C2679B|nr:type IV pilin N-terminal domain-containing protein [Natrinema gelatinilyticum]